MKQFYAVLQSSKVLCITKRSWIESASNLASVTCKSNLKTLSLVFLFAMSVLIGTQKVNAQLVTEDFSYTASSGLVTTNGYIAITGTGTNDLTVAASGSGLTYTGSPRSGVGLALPMANTGQDVYKSFTSQTSGAVYASALINLSAVNATGDYFFCLMTGSTFNVRLFAKTATGGYVLGIGKSSGTAVYDATVRSLNSTVLVVIKYQFNTGTTTDDIVSLFINPTLGAAEPAVNASAGPPTTDAASISSYGFRQGTAANAPTLVIDGIMVGTTWASVTPLNTTPTITPSGNVTGLNYTEGSGPSTGSPITVSASNLSAGPGNITFTSSANFEVSTTSATTGFVTSGNTVTLGYTGTGTISPNTVWVRLKAGLTAGTYPAETISISGGGATASFTAAGSVTPATPTITSPATLPTVLAAVSATNPSASVARTFTLSASNLTSNLTITASAPYEISTPSVNGGAYASALNLGTTVSGMIISVRLAANTTAGNYNSGTVITSTSDAPINNVTIATITGTVYSGTFSSGSLAIETIGDGSTGLTSAAANISVREYSNTGTLTNVFSMPGATTGLPSSAPWYMVESGSATSAGQINRSSDGAHLSFPGYNALVTTAAVATTVTPTNKRVLGVLESNGTLSTSAFDFFSASNFRSVASNGHSFWAAGTVTGGTGLYYLKDANATPVSLGSINTRVVKIFNNKLFYATATTGGTGIYQVSTNGLPLSISDITLTRLTDATYAGTATSSPYAFDINSTEDVMYVADDAAFVNTSTPRGGVMKFTKVAGVWTFQYTLPSPVNSARGLTVDWSTGGGSTPTIYITTTASTNNALAKIVDAGSTSTGTSLATAGANYVFRGVQFSPSAVGTPYLTCTANLLAFGGEPVGFTTPEKVFNVAGVGYSGNITVSVPVTAPTDQYGLSLTPGGPYSSTLTNVPNNSTIYMVLQPSAVGTYNGNLTISATGASNLLVPVTGKGIIPVNYYNSAGADVTLLNTWWDNPALTGNHPVNFTDDGQYFNINNAPLALASSATTAVIDQTASTSNGGATLVFTGVPTCNNSPQSLIVGATISGSGIPGGTTILSISANTITMSANATASASGVTISVGVSGPWTISGSLSKIIVGSGINFTIPSTRAYSGTADVAASGTLTLQNTTIPTLGTLDVTSTVNYNQTGAATVVTATYGNLTLQGAALDARTLPASSNLSLDLTVAGNFTANNVTVSAATVSPFTYMQLGGNFTMSNGAVMVTAAPLSTSGFLNIVTTGNSNQTFSYTGGGTIRINTLTSTKSAGTMTLGSNTTLLAHTQQSPITTYPGIALNFSGTASFVSQASSSLNTTGSANIHLNFSGTSTFTMGGDINASDNSSASFTTPITPSGSIIASFASGTTFTDGGNSITVGGNLGLGGVAGAYNLTGTVNLTSRGGVSLIGDATLSDVPVAHFNNLNFAPIAGTSTSFSSAGISTIYIDGNFTIGGTATTNKISGGSNNIVKLAGNYTNSRTVDMVNPSTTTWEFAGTAPQTFSTAYASGESFYSVKIDNSTGVTMSAGDFNIGASGQLNCTSGTLTTGANKVILSATGTINESTTSYVIGNVETTRTLGTTTEPFGGMGMSITTPGSAAGATTLLRNTGTSNNIGCLNSSVKRTFTVTNGGSGLNATVQYTFVPANELNSLTEAELKLFDVTGNTAYLTAGYNNLSNTFTLNNANTIAGVYSAAVESPNLIITNPAAVCSPATIDLTDAAVTAGSDAGALTYHTTIAGTTTQPNPNMVANGTYYIKLTNTSGCISIQPVVATVTTSVAPSVSIAITSGTNPACQGGSVTFTATPTNGGTGETYDWYRDGVLVPSVSTNSYTASNITATTTVYAVMNVGTGICVTASSATSSTTTITIISNSWTGSFSNAWGDFRNWCAGTAPTGSTNVLIPVTSRNPVLTGHSSVNNINIAAGASVIMSNVTLTVNGLVTGTGTFDGVSNTNSGLTFTNNGNIGTLYFGSGGIKSLIFSGTGSSATLGNTTSVYGELNVANTTLNTGGNLILKSTINGTSWVAPISTGTVNGIVTVERYIPRNGFRAWRMLSVPVQGTETFKQAWQENQSPLVVGTPGFGTLLTSIAGGSGYDQATPGNSLLTLTNGNPGNFVAVSSTNNAMQTNKGYFVYIRGDRTASITGGVFNPTATTLRTHGTLYSGTQSAITLPANENVMVGNIYASAIDFTTMTKSGISSFKVWDPKIAGTSNTGGYQTFSSSNGYDPTPGGGSYTGLTSNTRIESGQAFILNSTSGGSVQMTEAAKTSGSRNVFRTSTLYKQFKASILAYTINGLQLADGNSVVFDPLYSNNIDNDDAVKSNNIGENFGIVKSNGVVLQIEARQPIQAADTIRYKLWNVKQQQYQLRFVARNVDTPGLTAVLIDSFTNTVTPINTVDTTLIDINITSNPASYSPTRFKVVFKIGALPVKFTKISAVEKNRKSEIEWKVASELNVMSYDVEHSTDGNNFEKIGNIKAKGSNESAIYAFTHETPKAGNNYYRIKALELNAGKQYSESVKVKIDNIKSSITAVPNPVINNNLNLVFAGMQKGNYEIRLINTTGQILFSKNILHNGENLTKTIILPSVIVNGYYQLEIITNNNSIKNTQKILINNN